MNRLRRISSQSRSLSRASSFSTDSEGQESTSKIRLQVQKDEGDVIGKTRLAPAHMKPRRRRKNQNSEPGGGPVSGTTTAHARGMVKADAKRDYYADMDLQPTTENVEIKPQFRLLAKMFHPDRNPGHETEFVGKWQALQVAHEILAEPAERKKYDLARAKYVAKYPHHGYSKSTRAFDYETPFSELEPRWI